MRPAAIAAVLSLCCLSLAATARADCPPPPDHSEALAALVAEVQEAESEREARPITNRMWELWADAPDDQAQEILDRGLTRRSGYDFAGALSDFETLIDYCPDYAEGYNQRAFIHFIRQDYVRALPDLDRALELSPDHIAARAGRALTLLALGREVEARDELQAALEMNPWLPERGLMDRLEGLDEEI